jgi:Lrp/AsnC family leucine-responsive transcriptional regulator
MPKHPSSGRPARAEPQPDRSALQGELDSIDLEILRVLQDNARTTNRDLAASVGLAASATLARVDRLERLGVIRGYHAEVDPEAIGLGLIAFVFVRTNTLDEEVALEDRLAAMPDVLNAYHIAGEDGFLVTVRARDTRHLSALINGHFRSLPGLRGTRTVVSLLTVKESHLLPLPSDAPSPRRTSGAKPGSPAVRKRRSR